MQSNDNGNMIVSNVPENKGSTRIVMLDALRGFTLLGILLIHSVYRFQTGLKLSDPTLTIPWLDGKIDSVIIFLFSGKAYALFCFFLGFGYYIQFSSRVKKGYDYSKRYIWRLAILLVFGMVNIALYRGDILVLYALTGSIVVLTRFWNNRSVLILAITLILIPFDWFRIIRYLINPDASPLYFARSLPSIKYAVTSGSFTELIRSNLGPGLRENLLWYIDEGRVFQAPGLFLLGVLAGRIKLLTHKSKNFYISAFLASVIGATILFYTKKYLISIISNENIVVAVNNILTLIYNVVFSAALLFGFIRIWHTKIGESGLTFLAKYGKMSLTVYLTQSLFGVFAFYGFGFSLTKFIGSTACIFIALIFFGIQLYFSHRYLKTHQFGPVEYIWRKLTWIKFPKLYTGLQLKFLNGTK